MKNRLFVTLTDVKGSRQFGLSKHYVYRGFSTFALFLLGLLIYPLWLNVINGDLNRRNEVLQARHQQLSVQTAELEQQRQQLTTQLTNQSIDLAFSQQQFDTVVKQINMQGDDILTENERFHHISSQIAFRQMFLQVVPNGRPVNYDRVTSSYGHRTHPFLNKRYLHKGIDVHSYIGTEVIATADGVVTSIQNTQQGFGKLIKVNHGMGFTTYYGHLKRIGVKARQFVHKGEVIGYSGNSGRSTGPHLHYEVRFGNAPLDPANFILLTLNNFDSQLDKIREIPWDSLMVSMQKLMAAQPLPLSPRIATSTENSILMAACTSMDGCPATSNVLAPSP